MNRAANSPSLGVVLLAAGPSSRLGRPKQLVQLDGESLVARSAILALSLQPAFVNVVTGFAADRVGAELAGLPVNIVMNRNWTGGMGGSINCGVRTMPCAVDGVLILVCDQWKLLESDLKSLHEAWLTDISRIQVASWREGTAYVSGPPVIFPGRLLPELKSLQENRGARQLIDRYMEIVEYVAIENAAYDLDRPEDLERL